MDVVQTSLSTQPGVGNDPNSAVSNNGLTSSGRTIRAVAIVGIATMALTGVGGIIASSILPTGSSSALVAGVIGGVSAGIAVLGSGLAMKYA
ncbi:hypothetical protein DO628_25175 [Salmonella enterica subsp. salamae]|uniref:Type III secretion system protein SepZ n=12 Tax=Salmonella enterica TaxID=28901 RepID=A0A344QXJ7_SALER|nr:hypothetical protein [Salmonella enterica]AFO66339.1 putative LEE-encoded putative type III secretion system factor [Salmonella enterica subsp. salamae serovar Sofia]EBI0478642.1 hypothetical protein [Salmonella enterica subsp. enterica serovar Braenderup]EBK2700551.1 hypothetical protein [Salmonella enterica subsp. enterica serovar Paratyphi B]ECG1420278.1 hypothetical protein [Salmonella enterica subsp. salamae str. CFSAN000559]ECI2499481.1 hypothetical protein [Salmonella enterica subsp.